MNPTILNRDFKHPADGWYHIESKGKHPNQEARVVQVIDDEATQSIVNRFNADAAAGELRHGSEMLIDHEHFSEQPDQETRAYGWLQQLQNREDGIYGRIRWTATGQAAVDGGDYRFFSTEYDPEDVKILNSGKMKAVRPLRLGGLSLTNMHNNRGQKPITNRNDLRTEAGADKNRNHNHNQRHPMKSVCSALGLSADASEESILAEVQKVLNRATGAEKELTPVKNRVTELETANTTLLTEQIEADFGANKITDETIINRHKGLLADPKHFKNRADRVEFIKDLAKAAPAPASQNKLFNRETKPPGQSAVENPDAKAEKAKADKIMNRAHAIRKDAPGTSLPTAVRMAQSEMENAS